MNYSSPSSISLRDDILKIIDAQRGDIPRSRWIIRILESTYKQNSNTTKLEGQRKGNRKDSLETQIEPRNQANLLTHRVDAPMSQDTIYAQDNKEICEAIGCSAQATEKIRVKVGQKGMICLYLCSNCVRKFT